MRVAHERDAGAASAKLEQDRWRGFCTTNAIFRLKIELATGMKAVLHADHEGRLKCAQVLTTRVLTIQQH